MPALAHPDAVIAIRTLIALVFVSAAIGKMRAWPIFQGVVANYRLLPQVLVAPVTYVLPPAEAAIGAILPTGLLAPWAEGAAAPLFHRYGGWCGLRVEFATPDGGCPTPADLGHALFRLDVDDAELHTVSRQFPELLNAVQVRSASNTIAFEV